MRGFLLIILWALLCSVTHANSEQWFNHLNQDSLISQDVSNGMVKVLKNPVEVTFKEPIRTRNYPFGGVMSNKTDEKTPRTTPNNKYQVVAYRKTQASDRFGDGLSRVFLGVDRGDGKLTWIASHDPTSGKRFYFLTNTSSEKDFETFEDKPTVTTVKQPNIIPTEPHNTLAYKNLSTVMTAAQMNCRTSGNFYGDENITGMLIPEGTKGTVIGNVKDSKSSRIVGYHIQFGQNKCWIHAPGLTQLSEDSSIKSEVNCPCPKTLNTNSTAIDNLANQTNKIINKIENPGDPKCQKPYDKCEQSVFPKNINRYKWDKFITEAANQFDLPPELIKSQVAAETSLGAQDLENKTEKAAFSAGGGDRTYLWGRGIGQFGANNAHNYGLAWYQDRSDIIRIRKTELEAKYKVAYGSNKSAGDFTNEEFESIRKLLSYYLPGDTVTIKGAPRVLKSVNDPKAAIFAKAQLLKQNYDQKYIYDMVDSKGVPSRIDINLLLKSKPDKTEAYRLAVAAYNRGPGRIQKSIYAFGINHESTKKQKDPRIPDTYIDIALEKMPSSKTQEWKKSELLVSHPVGRCHVYKILGLCGSSKGYLKEFSSDFKSEIVGDRRVWKTI